jgi:NADH-quinone oxidoreductase subunit M
MNTFDDWALTLAVFLPLVGVAVIALIPRANEELHKIAALVTSLLTLGVGVYLLLNFDFDNTKTPQFEVNRTWIDVINSHYHVFIDGIALPLLILSMFITVLCVIYSWDHFPEPHNPKAFLILMLVLEVGMNGTFVAQDLILFFVFFELVLLPMYFMIGVWGGANRQYAAIKFFLFTLFGSALMILSFLALYFLGGNTFDIPELVANGASIAKDTQVLIFAGLFMGFAIKVPMFPFHTWLPDAHTDAPTAGSVILAAVMLKMGTYGFLRFSLPILPDGTRQFVPFIVVLCIIGIVYGALVALAQKDWKRLVAYSSVSHMAMVMLGMFALNPVGIAGSIIQQLNHGISTGGLFLLVGVVYERRHTREISEYGGLSKVMPVYAAIFLVMTMSSIGLPTLNGFIGELLILQGVFTTTHPFLGGGKIWAGFAASGVVLGAAYMLYLYQRTMFGKVENPKNERLLDISQREFATFAPLLILAVWMGLYPKPFIDRLRPSVDHIIARVSPQYSTPAARIVVPAPGAAVQAAAVVTPPVAPAAAETR